MSSSRSLPPPEDDALAEQAAAWLARRDRGFTAAEQDEFFLWLGADPRHGEALARHQGTVRRLRALAQWRPEHAAAPNPDLLAPRPALAPRFGVLRWALPLAAAAAFALGWFTVTRLPAPPPAVVVAVEPITRRLLEDGSAIDLNRGASVEVNFTPAERRVTLAQGEAYFTVAKNPARPFVVLAGGVAVRAVGTAFNVHLQPEGVAVLVTEGCVEVKTSTLSAVGEASARLVGVGERVLVRAAQLGEVEAVAPEEVARLLAWQPRQLEFNDTPLGQVAAEFNRDNTVKIVVDDPALASLPIGASLRSDNVEGFVRMLEASFQVKAEWRADGVVVLRARAEN